MPPESNSPQLPEAVKILKKTEKQPAVKPVTPIAATKTPTEPKPTKMLFNFIPWSGRTGLAFKVLFAVVGIFFLCFVILFLMMIGSIDTSVFKLSLVGTVVDPNNQPVVNATVKLDDKQTTTDNNGRFQFFDLQIQTYHLLIQANAYEDYKEDIVLARGFLSYTTYKTFKLSTAGDGSITAKFVASDSTYKFLDDKVVVGDKTFKVNDDGTVNATGLKTGDVVFEFQSANYKDVKQSFKLEPGKNDRGEIPLTPAGDITASVKSWIKEDIVKDLGVTVEGVPAEQIKIAEDGTLLIKDLEVGRTYKMRTQWPGYQTRDYSVEVKQGTNEIFGFKVVENGKLPFLRKVGDENELFVSEFDGSNPKQITTGRVEPYGEYISGEIVYFLSTRDNQSSTLNGNTFLVYAANATSGNAQRITTNSKGFGRIVPNLAAGKLANITTNNSQEDRKLEVMGLDGNGRVTIKTLPDGGSFTDVAISGNGKYVFYYAQDKAKSINGLYRADTATGQGTFIVNKPNLQILSVNANGDRVLYSATNTATNLQDLYLYIMSTGQDTTVRAAFTGGEYQFIRGSDTSIIYQDTKNGGTNVYTLDLSQNKETALTSFSGTEAVEAVYQQAGFIVYQTNKGLYMMDFAKPHPGKLVTSNSVRYTGYDF